MRKFDTLIESYEKQITIKEADGDPTLSGFIRSIISPITAGRPLTTPNYKPENVYYLYEGYKSLTKLREKLGPLLKISTQTQAPVIDKTIPLKTNDIVTGQGPKVNGLKLLVVKDMGVTVEVKVLDKNGNPYPTSVVLTRLTDIVESMKTPINEAAPPPQTNQPTSTKIQTFDALGNISDKNEFATRLYNAFDEAGELNRNYITLNELNRGYLRPISSTGTSHGQKEEIGEFANIPKNKAHASVMKFIRDQGLSSIILYVRPEDIPELDKGSRFKRIKKAMDIGAAKALQGLGKAMTSGQVTYI